nr:unnamed protein product [Digitaria exilis]
MGRAALVRIVRWVGARWRRSASWELDPFCRELDPELRWTGNGPEAARGPQIMQSASQVERRRGVRRRRVWEEGQGTRPACRGGGGERVGARARGWRWNYEEAKPTARARRSESGGGGIFLALPLRSSGKHEDAM